MQHNTPQHHNTSHHDITTQRHKTRSHHNTTPEPRNTAPQHHTKTPNTTKDPTKQYNTTLEPTTQHNIAQTKQHNTTQQGHEETPRIFWTTYIYPPQKCLLWITANCVRYGLFSLFFHNRSSDCWRFTSRSPTHSVFDWRGEAS